jgi:hypothetical protein
MVLLYRVVFVFVFVYVFVCSCIRARARARVRFRVSTHVHFAEFNIKLLQHLLAVTTVTVVHPVFRSRAAPNLKLMLWYDVFVECCVSHTRTHDVLVKHVCISCANTGVCGLVRLWMCVCVGTHVGLWMYCVVLSCACARSCLNPPRCQAFASATDLYKAVKESGSDDDSIMTTLGSRLHSVVGE